MRREYDELGDLPVRRVAIAPATLDEIPQLVRFAAAEIPALAAAEAAVVRVQRRDPESVWAFRRDGKLVGIYAMLMFNAAGLERLRDGAFEFADPPLDSLSEPDEMVVAIYKWAVVARGTAAEGIRAISRHLHGPRYAAADFYARAIGEAAQRLDSHLGFRPVQPGSDLLIYVRIRNRVAHPPIAA